MTHPLIMLKLLKSLRFLILALLVLVNFSAIAYENFDECGLAVNEIKKRHAELSLDSPDLSEMSSIFFKKKYYGVDGDWFFVRSKNNNIFLESTPPDSVNFKFLLAPMTEILKIDGHEVDKLSDEEIVDIKEKNWKNKKINIQYRESQNQIRSVSINRKINITPVEIIPTIASITQINSNSSSYDANLKNQLMWWDSNLRKIFKGIYKKIKNTKEFKAMSSEYKGSIVCTFSKSQWNDMGLWTPELTYTNLAESYYEGAERKYTIEFNENIYPEEEVESHRDNLVIYMMDHKIGKFKGDFNFKAFPFDGQKLAFRYNFNSAESFAYPYFNDFMVYSSNYKNLKFNDWVIKGSPDYRYYDYFDPIGFGKIYSLEISMPIDRNFQYYLLKIFLPILIILLVAWSCFWVSPKELESRLTVSIVCLLSLIAYTFVIDKDLPKLSYFTIMDYAVLLSYAFSTVPTFESIYVNRVASKSIKKAVKIDSIFIKFTPILYLSLMMIIFYLYTADSKNIITALS